MTISVTFSTVTLIAFGSCFCLQKTSNQEQKIISSNDLKYVLLWTDQKMHPFFKLVEGQQAFIKSGCPEVNCYVTSNRSLFMGDLTKFDAIVFNGRNTHYHHDFKLPNKRSPQQIYIYTNQESAQYYPVCMNLYNNFYNWTATYRLDSDIVLPYFLIKKSAGKIVGPMINMTWMNETFLEKTTYNNFYAKMKKKSKAAAWFMSNSNDKIKRKDFARQLQANLNVYGLTIDIYGTSQAKTCPKDSRKCDIMLENDYYFYLALENSCSKDYVTEKILRALNHFTIPIVYGCADYSRFLPSSSYIDGNTMSAADIAALMHRLIQSPRQYLQYMWWRDHYSYHDVYENYCAFCSALHNKSMVETQSVYIDFKRWWYPNYRDVCIKKNSGWKQNLKNMLWHTTQKIVSAASFVKKSSVHLIARLWKKQ